MVRAHCEVSETWIMNEQMLNNLLKCSAVYLMVYSNYDFIDLKKGLNPNIYGTFSGHQLQL